MGGKVILRGFRPLKIKGFELQGGSVQAYVLVEF
jgi:hypothetical protein